MKTFDYWVKWSEVRPLEKKILDNNAVLGIMLRFAEDYHKFKMKEGTFTPNDIKLPRERNTISRNIIDPNNPLTKKN